MAADMFGFTPAMMECFRGTGEEENFETIAHYVQLTKIVAEGNVPISVAYFLTGGKLTALNKIAAALNRARIAAGLKPFVRPVKIPPSCSRKHCQ